MMMMMMMSLNNNRFHDDLLDSTQKKKLMAKKQSFLMAEPAFPQSTTADDSWRWATLQQPALPVLAGLDFLLMAIETPSSRAP